MNFFTNKLEIISYTETNALYLLVDRISKSRFVSKEILGNYRSHDKDKL